MVPFISLLVIFFLSLVEGKLNYLKFYFLAADSFYYFSVATEKIFSFDNVYLTNGYHPLWQIFLVLLNIVGVSKSSMITTALLMNMFFLTVSLFIFYKMFYERIKSNPSILFLIVPGSQFLFLIFTNRQNYLHFFSFLNGMESSLTILLVTLLIFSLRKKYFNEIYVGFLLLMIVLTRLDNIFLLFTYSLFKIYKSKKLLHKEIVISSIGIAFYLILNKYYFGTYLPVSGLTKSSFSLLHNYSIIFNIFISKIEFTLNAFNKNIFQDSLFWRIIQVFFPLSFSIYFYFVIKKFKIIKSYFTDVLLMFVALKSTYYFFTSNFWTQGHWYFPASFVILSFLLVEYSSELKKIIDVESFIKSIAIILGINWFVLLFYSLTNNYQKSIDLFEIIYIPVLIIIVSSSLILITSFFYISIFAFKRKKLIFTIYLTCITFIQVNHYINSNYHYGYFQFYEQRHEINSSLEKIKNFNNKILSFDDGIVNYYLDSEVMNGLKLSIDSDAYFRSKSESIYDIAYSRGYRYFGSLNYLSDFDLIEGSHFMDDKSFNKYDIKTVYESNNNNFILFQFIEEFDD